MNPNQKPQRRRRQIQPCAETLEPRELLTGGAGDTFAIISGTISTPGGTVSIPFTIDPSHFTRPSGKMTLGIDVVPDPSGTLKPLIASVTNPHGAVVPQTFHSIYDPHLQHRQVANGQGTSAVLTPVSSYPGDRNKPVTETVQVTAEDKSSGNFLLGFYLPGDANGDGKVDQTDIKIIKSEMGATANSSKYTFDADANRDGRIGPIDLTDARLNLGVSTNISPVVAANLVPGSVSDPNDRQSNRPSAQFTGTATPNATITYTNTSDPKATPITTTTDGTGNYSITVPLVPGSNVFQVKSADAFGQSITGNIQAVMYNPPA